MSDTRIQEIDRIFVDNAQRLDFVIVPGLYDSCPEHWQTCWQKRYPHWKRISQSSWSPADIDRWISAITRTLEQCEKPAILIGHSFGALASHCLADTKTHPKIAAVMLVAPAEPARFELEDRIHADLLAIPSLVVASHTDPLLRFERAQYWAQAWGSELADIGEAGHINAESGFGPWLYGLSLLGRLIEKVAT